jgi:hypothetical protein
MIADYTTGPVTKPELEPQPYEKKHEITEQPPTDVTEVVDRLTESTVARHLRLPHNISPDYAERLVHPWAD